MNFLHKIWSKLTQGQEESRSFMPEDEQDLKSFRVVVSELLEAGMDHCAALTSLFFVEVGETLQKIRRKVVCLIAGLFLLFVAYLFACAALTSFLTEWMGVLYALLCVAGLHAIVGVILLLVAVKKPIGPIVPETVNEIKSDYECLQIAIKENRNS